MLWEAEEPPVEAELPELLLPQAASPRTMAIAMVKARNFFIIAFSFSISAGIIRIRCVGMSITQEIFIVNR